MGGTGGGRRGLRVRLILATPFFKFYIRRAWRDGFIALGVFNAPPFSPGFCGSS